MSLTRSFCEQVAIQMKQMKNEFFWSKSRDETFKSCCPPEIVEIKRYSKMQAKTKLKKVGRPGAKQVCCSLLTKVKPDIDRYIQDLIESKYDSSKIKWAWGIITAVRQITEIKASKKTKSFLCPKCKLYLEPRRRLAELIIQGCRYD